MTSEELDLHCIDIYTLASRVRIPVTRDQRTAEALATAGYIGNTPITPSIAISFDTLELFRCLKLVKASFSTEAFAKLICYKYCVSAFFFLPSSTFILSTGTIQAPPPDGHRGCF